jgi:hypothetical protein
MTGRPSPLDHVLGDARLRDLKPELEQFAVDAWRARKPALCQRTSVSGRMIVRTFRIAGNQRYSWKEPAIMVREPNATTRPAPQDNQLMSKHRVLGFNP